MIHQVSQVMERVPAHWTHPFDHQLIYLIIHLMTHLMKNLFNNPLNHLWKLLMERPTATDQTTLFS